MSKPIQPTVQGTLTPPTKRKHAGDPASDSQAAKRPRDDCSSSVNTPESRSLQPLTHFLAELKPKYEVKTLSVISSTTISQRVATILEHLGRFHPWDKAVLPGVVLLYARASAVNKLITIAETVRRRINEADQKWFQYNRLYEMDWLAGPTNLSKKAPPADYPSLKEQEKVLAEESIAKDAVEDEGEYFETMREKTPTVFERAVKGESKEKKMAHMSIFLSRVPVPELRENDDFAMQSNEEHIEYLRKKKAGLA